ncbi:MAG: sigma-54 dependent transcriptional regulator [Candidatus Margulisiibacteriota bacterium]
MKKPVILAVDDEADMLETYKSVLSKSYSLLTASSGEEALQKLKETPVSLVLLDLKMPKMDGLTFLSEISKEEPDFDVIIVTASKDLSSAVEAMKLGAYDYITKPFDVKELQLIIEKALEKRAIQKENVALKENLKEAFSFCEIIGQSPEMKKLFQTIEKVAPGDSTVLISGESGTGKELVARAIHKMGKRKDKPFVVVNCAAIPENLMESELFGYERGAFTGALERRIGKFELADGGTLFLDEIGCMPAAMQSKLLRVLEDNVVERLGGQKGIEVDVRIISATNINFKESIEKGSFREDLFYRLNVFPINIPPLRERKSDIPLLLQTFIQKFNRELNKKVKGTTPAAQKSLLDYHWPGNVRELQNVIERAIVLSDNAMIDTEELLFPLGATKAPNESTKPADSIENLNDAVNNLEKGLILKALQDNNNNRSEAAIALGIPRSTLTSKIKVLGIS